VRTLIMITLALFLAGCSNHSKDMSFSGTLEITEHVLGVKVPGRISTVDIKEGDMVKAGQVLATLDRYAQAKKDAERTDVLYKSGGANTQAVEYAQLSLEDQEVVSPIDGVVLVKTVESGETVAAGAGVVVVGDVKDQWVKIFVPEGAINRLTMNQAATVSFDGNSKTYQGHVSFIAIKAEFTPRNVQTAEERVTQAFAVKVSLDQPDANLHAGVAADIKFTNL